MLSFRKYSISFFLLLWFWVWGICPWDSAATAAHPLETAHTEHGHHGMDDTHHASKGTEHSCSGSISYSSKLQKDRPCEQVVWSHPIFPSTDPGVRLNQSHGYQKLLFERSTLPKLLTEYYQLYAIYRI
jgi:hypothetical protein